MSFDIVVGDTVTYQTQELDAFSVQEVFDDVEDHHELRSRVGEAHI